jgi:hypothetical protein
VITVVNIALMTEAVSPSETPINFYITTPRNSPEVCHLNTTGSGNTPVAGFCEHGNELLGSIHDGKYLGQLSDFQLL